MTLAESAAEPRRRASPGWWLMFLLALGIAGYAWRLVAVGLGGFDSALGASFARHPWAIATHMLFGGAALVTGALNYRHDLRRARPTLHRQTGTLYVATALLSGAAGGWLAHFALGGLANKMGFGLLAAATLTTTALAYRAALSRDFTAHRAWMMRSYACILAAVSLRLELPLLALAFGDFSPAYAVVAWSCWVPNLLVAEWLVRRAPAPPL
jgi:uncharacterized membrane protein